MNNKRKKIKKKEKKRYFRLGEEGRAALAILQISFNSLHYLIIEYPQG
jgi:hypothetical protein